MKKIKIKLANNEILSSNLYPVNTKVIVKEANQYWIGTIKEIKNKKYKIILNNGNEVILPIDSPNLIGKSKKSSIKKPIPLIKLADFLKEEKRIVEILRKEFLDKDYFGIEGLEIGDNLAIRHGKFFSIGKIIKITTKAFVIKFYNGEIEEIPKNSPRIIGIVPKYKRNKNPIPIDHVDKYVVKYIQRKEKGNKQKELKTIELPHLKIDIENALRNKDIKKVIRIVKSVNKYEVLTVLRYVANSIDKIDLKQVDELVNELTDDNKILLFSVTENNRAKNQILKNLIKKNSPKRVLSILHSLSTDISKEVFNLFIDSVLYGKDIYENNKDFFNKILVRILINNQKFPSISPDVSIKKIVDFLNIKNPKLLVKIAKVNETIANMACDIIDSKYLPDLIDIEFDDVQVKVAKKIPKKYLIKLIDSKNKEVRKVVAKRIPKKYLPKLINDKDRNVRSIVAKRIQKKYLPRLINDEDENVRSIVAERIDKKYLPRLMNDKSPFVLSKVVLRIDKKYIQSLVENILKQTDKSPYDEVLTNIVDRLEETKEDAKLLLRIIKESNALHAPYRAVRKIDESYLENIIKSENNAKVVNEAIKRIETTIDDKIIDLVLNKFIYNDSTSIYDKENIFNTLVNKLTLEKSIEVIKKCVHELGESRKKTLESIVLKYLEKIDTNSFRKLLTSLTDKEKLALSKQLSNECVKKLGVYELLDVIENENFFEIPTSGFVLNEFIKQLPFEVIKDIITDNGKFKSFTIYDIIKSANYNVDEVLITLFDRIPIDEIEELENALYKVIEKLRNEDEEISRQISYPCLEAILKKVPVNRLGDEFKFFIDKIDKYIESTYLKGKLTAIMMERIPFSEIDKFYNYLNERDNFRYDTFGNFDKAKEIYKLRKELSDIIEPVISMKLEKDYEGIRKHLYRTIKKKFKIHEYNQKDLALLLKDLSPIFKYSGAGLIDLVNDWIRTTNSIGSLYLRFLAGEVKSFRRNNNDFYVISSYEREFKKHVKEYEALKEDFKVMKILAHVILDLQFPNTKTITLFRGSTLDETVKKGDEFYAECNSLSSWTTDFYIAYRFASSRKQELNKRGIIMKTEIDKDNVIITPSMIASNESEFVISVDEPIKVMVMEVFD